MSIRDMTEHLAGANRDKGQVLTRPGRYQVPDVSVQARTTREPPTIASAPSSKRTHAFPLPS